MYMAGVKNTIDTGDIYFDEISRIDVAGRTDAVKRLKERARIIKLEISQVTPLEAQINHSRWIAICPHCHNAEFIFEDKLFFCSVCQNSYIGGKTRQVVLPQDRQEIEDVLLVRPIFNRHWFPNETLKDLKVENIEHGLGVA